MVFGLMALGAPLATAASGDEAEDGKARVLILPTQWQEGVSEVVPSRLDVYLMTLLEVSGQARFFNLANLERPPVKEVVEIPVEDPVLKKADALLWDAKEKMGKGKYFPAAASFKKARKAYESRFALLVDFDKYVDASLGVALAFFYGGAQFEAERALKRVLAHRPDLLLDKRKVPKEAIAVLEKLQHLQTRAPLCQVRIESTPPGAEIFIDGVRAGQTPYVGRNLVKGLHVIRLVREGYKPFAKAIKLSAKGHVVKGKLKALKSKAAQEPTFRSPEPLVTLVQQGSLGPRFQRIAAQVAKFYTLDSIVMSYARKNANKYEVSTFLWEGDKGRIAELDWIRLDGDLSDMQVNLLNLEEQLLAGLAFFPQSRKLSGRSDIYINEDARRLVAEKKRAAAERRALEIEIAREARAATRASKAREIEKRRQAALDKREARRAAKEAAAARVRQVLEQDRAAKAAAKERAKEERLRQRSDRLAADAAAKDRAKEERLRKRTDRLAAQAAAREDRLRERAERSVAKESREADRRREQLRNLERERQERAAARELVKRQSRQRTSRPESSPLQAPPGDELSRLEELERRARQEADRLAAVRRRIEKRLAEQKAAVAAASAQRADEARLSRAEQKAAAAAASARRADEGRLSRERKHRARVEADRLAERRAEAAAAAAHPATRIPNVAPEPILESALDDPSLGSFSLQMESWASKWWVWAGAGAVAAVVTGAIVLAGDEGSDAGFKARAQW